MENSSENQSVAAPSNGLSPAFVLAPRLPSPGTPVTATLVINSQMAREIADIIDDCCEHDTDKALVALARQLENYFVRGQNPIHRPRVRRTWGSPSSAAVDQNSSRE